MTRFIKLCVITSKGDKKLKSFMERYPHFYEITEDEVNKIADTKVYFVKMDVGFDLDLDFLIKMKKYTKSIISIIGTSERLS